MLIRIPFIGVLTFTRRALSLVPRRQSDTPWVDDTTPHWVTDGIINPSAKNTLQDVSGAFDDSRGL